MSVATASRGRGSQSKSHVVHQTVELTNGYRNVVFVDVTIA